MSWQRLKHGYICERIIGFSIPISGEVAVISYEGVHLVPLGSPENVTHYPEFAEGGDLYDTEHQRLNLGGRSFAILGLHGGTPRLCSALGEQLAFREGDAFSICDATGQEIFSHCYNDLSGDWRAVTFSTDDEHIIFGLPYELEIFRRVTAASVL